VRGRRFINLLGGASIPANDNLSLDFSYSENFMAYWMGWF